MAEILVGLGTLISGVAAIVAARRSGEAKTEAAQARAHVQPNGTGHASLTAMVEDVLNWQTKHDARHARLERRLGMVEEAIDPRV